MKSKYIFYLSIHFLLIFYINVYNIQKNVRPRKDNHQKVKICLSTTLCLRKDKTSYLKNRYKLYLL